MKKLFALLMVAGFAFAFVACGGQKEEASEGSESIEAPAEEPAVEEPTMEEPVDTTTVDTAATEM